MTTETIYRRGDLKSVTGLSSATIYRMMSVGTFPRPIPLSIQAVGWLKSEIDSWLAGRVAARTLMPS